MPTCSLAPSDSDSYGTVWPSRVRLRNLQVAADVHLVVAEHCLQGGGQLIPPRAEFAALLVGGARHVQVRYSAVGQFADRNSALRQ